MLHIFHIHSYINYVTSLGVIENKGLCIKDVRFVLCRGVESLNHDIQTIEMPDCLYYFPFFTLKKISSFNFLKTPSIIRAIDKLIEIGTNNKPFIYYSPNSRNFLYRVFISHGNCNGVDYIEDGMDMYLGAANYSKKYPFKVPLIQKIAYSVFQIFFKDSQRIKPNKNPFNSFYGHKGCLYGITNESYGRLKYSNPVVKVSLKNQKIGNLPKDCSDYLLLDAVVEQDVITLEAYTDFINFFAKWYNKSTLGIKFHPFQTKQNRNLTAQIIKSHGIELLEIQDNIPFEVILFSEKKLSVYGIGSSLLKYSGLARQTTFIFYPYFKLKLKFISPREVFWKEAFLNTPSIQLYGTDFS